MYINKCMHCCAYDLLQVVNYIKKFIKHHKDYTNNHTHTHTMYRGISK